jgi:hypothetical protein
MIKINFCTSCENKKENVFIQPFVKEYWTKYFSETNEVKISCPKETSKKKTPDYFIFEPKVLVEVKRVYDKEEIVELAHYSKQINHLEEALKPRLKEVKGFYIVFTPKKLSIKKGKEKDIVDKILEAIKNNQKSLDIPKIGKFKISKFRNEGNYIDFTWDPVAKSVNPSEIIKQNIASKINTANIQLGSFSKDKVEKKILLLVNRYPLGDVNDMIEALSSSYRELLGYNNIDEIWIQYETMDKRFLHILLYTRDFLASFEEKRVNLKNGQHKELFEKWFYSLEKLGDNYKEELFDILKKCIKNQKPYLIFPDENLRMEIVQLGEYFAAKKRFSDVIWIIDKFIDDPDPGDPEKYSGEPDFNYHQKILNGEDPFIITTVLGHLAWVVQKLAIQKEYIEKALNYTKKLLSYKNLYVKFQAIIPLVEIAARRQWLDGWGKRPRESEYKKFHSIVFDLVELVSQNQNYKAIANRLVLVFSYYKDLSTEEVDKALNALKITNESAGLFVYFGIFRQRHYKDQHIEFDGKKFENKLKEIIKSNTEENIELKEKISFHFWQISKENKDEFEKIRPYIELFLEQPYQNHIYSNIEHIINETIRDKPDVCIEWYKQMLSRISKYLESAEPQNQIDLWLQHTEEIIEVLATYRPVELLAIVKILVDFWKKRVYIGSPKKIFESYKLISDEKLKNDIKKEFQILYNSMKKIHPGLEEVTWD